jgi:hypothetical protein
MSFLRCKPKDFFMGSCGPRRIPFFHDMLMPDLSSQGNVSYFLLVCIPFDRHLCEWLGVNGNQMPSHAFIDILVKSSKSEIQMLQLVHDHVLS